MGFYGYYSSNVPNCFDRFNYFFNYLLIIDSYSKTPKIYVMEIMTTEEVVYWLDMFQARIRKFDELGWWDLEIILADAGTQFTSTKFQGECQTRGVCLTLADLYHQ